MNDTRKALEGQNALATEDLATPDAKLVAAAIRAGFAEVANVTKFAAFYRAKGARS